MAQKFVNYWDNYKNDNREYQDCEGGLWGESMRLIMKMCETHNNLPHEDKRRLRVFLDTWKKWGKEGLETPQWLETILTNRTLNEI